MLRTRCLHQGFVSSSTTSNDTNHASCTALDDLLCARWELDTGLALIWVVTNDGNIVARGSPKRTTVTNLLLDVCYNSSFWDRAEGEDVSDSQVCVLASIDELTSVHALVRDEGLGVELEAVWISKLNLGQRSSSSWVMNDLLDYTSDVTMSLRIIEGTELRRRLVESCVGRENRSATFTLIANNSTHGAKILTSLSRCC